MKRVILISGLILFIALSCTGKTQERGKYGIKAGVIEYRIYPDKNTVAEQIYTFDNYGALQRKETSFTDNAGVERKILFLRTEEGVMSIEGNKGVKIPKDVDKLIKQMEEVVQSSPIPDPYKPQIIQNIRNQRNSLMGLDPLEVYAQTAEPIKEDTFLGKNCKVYEITEGGKITFYMWQGIPVRVLNEQGGVIEEAVKIEELEEVPQGTFDVPSDVELEDYLTRFKKSLGLES